MKVYVERGVYIKKEQTNEMNEIPDPSIISAIQQIEMYNSPV